MAKMVLTASSIVIATNDLSAYCSKIELATQVDEKDVTTFASAGWKEVLGGLGSGTLSLTFFQDVAASAIDSLIWPLFLARVPVAAVVKLTNAAVGTSNPTYTQNVLPSKWTPISGSVGDTAGVDVQWPTSGAVVRATS